MRWLWKELCKGSRTLVACGRSCVLWGVCVGTAQGIKYFLEIVFHPVGSANAEHFSGENLKLLTTHLTHRLLFGLKAHAFEIPQKSELCLCASCWIGWTFAWVAFSKMPNVLYKLHTASNIVLKNCIWCTVNYQQGKKHTILNLLKWGWERSQTLGGSCVLPRLFPA